MSRTDGRASRYHSLVTGWPLAAAIYGLGVVVGLWRVDGSPTTKVALALLWPIGPVAFVATVGLLVAASLIAFPWVGAAATAAAALVWWVLRS